MEPITIALLICLGSLAAALLGAALQLPREHLDEASQNVVKSVMGLVATLTALVLGLLVASAQSTYQGMVNQMNDLAANLAELDRSLELYGPETAPARTLFQHAVRAEIDRVWPNGEARREDLERGADRGQSIAFVSIIYQIPVRNEGQRFQQQRILQLVASFARLRTLIIDGTESDLPAPFMVVLVFWLAVLFFGFGLFARINGTVVVALTVGALSVAGAIYLVLEMNRPFDGLMRVSEAPLREALGQMGK
ncbi:hypothetical protein ACFQS7_25440 [Dankookia sp. GCM10030260]|uniref:bestrophin-like domain n=1 Tax=Dankookia sp. GCM10030260 TaxID=3273390 RepID=UPI003609D505